MTFKDGDFLEIEYTMWDDSDKSVLATTNEKTARDNNIYDQKMVYGPVLFVLGSPGMLKGLNKEVRGLNVNDAKKFTFNPDDAYGERDEDLVRVMPLAEFKERNINPRPGMRVQLDEITATVKSVNSGRVVIDANHPFAGKTVTYEIKVTKQLTATKDKIDALSRSYGVKPSEVAEKGKAVELSYDNKVSKNADYFIGRASFIASIFSYFENVDEVNVKEQYLRPKNTEKADE
ncbi:MAG: peptidylprolyl isomerase [Candidatus Marsarchaeota archaeon]|nr:peptidylprolyl isomerase [Candidatus Marsarchaeota archaeon]